MTSATTTSRVYRLDQLGGLDGLSRGVAQIPAPGPGEVLVRVRATSLNFRDLLILQGHYVVPVPAGRIPVSDAAGEIVAVGAGVRRLGAGDRVINAFFPEWTDGPYQGNYVTFSAEIEGWLADYRIVPESMLTRFPDSLGFEEAATLSCAGVTAWSAVKGIGPDDTILIQGTGGVSLFAIQLAKALGARVIATTSSDAKAEQLRAMGADDTINYKTHTEWSQQVLELTGGKGATRIVEVGGPGTFEQSVKAVAVGGQVTMIGVLAGMQGGVEFIPMFLSQARYQPIAVGSRADLDDLTRFVAEHGIRPVIDSQWDFEQAKNAYERLMGRDVVGKVVIKT